MKHPGFDEALQQRLKASFRSEMTVPLGTERHLADALETATSRAGNFIRAQLAYCIAVTHGAKDESALKLASALEYFHTASLLFDDLPSMDDATHRRGAECLHRIYGEGTTILTALAVINRGYALLWQTVAEATGQRQREALAYAERYLGLEGLLNGQSLDIHYSEQTVQDRSPQKVARGKTAGLIRLAIVLPALVYGASDEVVRLLDHLAVFWGLAYQGIDDLKDVLHSTERVGKTTERDFALGRPNLALARGHEAALWMLRKQVRWGDLVLKRVQEIDPRFACMAPAGQRLAYEVSHVMAETREVAA